MKFSSTRSFTTLFASLTILSLVGLNAHAQHSIGENWFSNGTSQVGSDVQQMYASNSNRPLGGLFAPGFTRTLTILGGANFPSGSTDDQFASGASDNVPDGSFAIRPSTRELEDSGYALSFAFGRRHSHWLRSEIEVAFRSDEVTNTRPAGPTITGFDGTLIALGSNGEPTEDGRVNVTSLMKNFIIDFDNGTRFTPYVGAGLGLSYIDVEFGEATNIAGEVTFQDDQTLFSYQAIAGVATQLNSVADFIVEYRFLGTSEVTFDGLDQDLAYNTSTLFLGVKFEY